MEHEFPFGTFRPEKQDYLFRRSVAQGNFPLVVYHLLSKRNRPVHALSCIVGNQGKMAGN